MAPTPIKRWKHSAPRSRSSWPIRAATCYTADQTQQFCAQLLHRSTPKKEKAMRLPSARPTPGVLLLAASILFAACSPRQVDVRTAPTQATAVSLQVNNTLDQAVNVYVTVSGSDTFLRQVGAKSNSTIPVQGIATGTTVNLKAVTVDGAKTYSRSNVVLNGTFV